jgi:hypothetical protein
MQALELIKLNHSHCGFAVSQSDFNIKEVERILTLKLPNSELQVRIDKAIPYQWKDGGKTMIDTIFKIRNLITYLLCWNLNTNFFNGFGKFIGLNNTIVI